MIKGVIYLDKTSLDYYAEKMQAIPKLVFPPAVIQDIEVIDIPKLDQMIKAFIDTNKLLPASLTIVLANSILFSKDIPKPDLKQIAKEKAAQKPGGSPVAPAPAPVPVASVEDQTLQFLEAVPFNEVSSITLPIPNGVKLVAANKDLYTDIKRAFEKYKFTVDAVTPLPTFGTSVAPVDATIARRLLQKVDLARQHNMLTVRQVSTIKPVGIVKPTDKKSKTRLFVMLGVFGVLFLILGIMTYTTFFAPAPPKKTNTVAPIAVVKKPTPTITLVPSPQENESSSSAILQKVTVQITQPPTGGTEAAQLKILLTKLGVGSVTVKKGTSAVSKTVVAFSKKLNPLAKTKISAVIQPLLPDASFIETDEQTADVVITLGKPTK